nr:MAG TPA: hypothetical protein [Caudoviricetes sp.]
MKWRKYERKESASHRATGTDYGANRGCERNVAG